MIEIPIEVTCNFFFFLLTCFHSQVLKFLWYHFDSSAYFKSLLKKRKKIKYVQIIFLGISSEKAVLEQYPLECSIKPNIHEEKPTLAKQSQNTKYLNSIHKSQKVKNRKAYAQLAKQSLI